ncbi:tyrosine-protein phosphatase [Caldicellulosiruptoraceae bacterium PP1]
MIDLHCHLMPNVDDGAKTLDEAREIIKLAQKEGIKEICVTPHFSDSVKANYNNLYEEFLRGLNNLDVILHKGCEYTLDSALYNTDNLITLANSDYVLVELKDGYIYEYTINQLYNLRMKGYLIILAHPERTFIDVDIRKLKKLKDYEIYFQITAGSITGKFGDKVKKYAFELLERGMCEIVSSDAHSAEKTTSKHGLNMQEAYKVVSKKFGGDVADILFIDNPERVITNKPLLSIDNLHKRGFLSKIFGGM